MYVAHLVFSTFVQNLIGHNLKQTISTLDRDRIQPSDFSDFSGSFVNSRTFLKGRPSTAIKYYARHQFPEKSHGFLYFHRPLSAGDGAGGIRLRVTPGPCPADFEAGTDLTTPDGRTWEIPMANLAAVKQYEALWKALLKEGLTNLEDLRICREQYRLNKVTCSIRIL